MSSQLINANEALKIILEHVQPLQPVTTALQHSLGRALAEDVVSEENVPPFDNAGMDGYAVRADDLKSVPAVLTLIGESAAGSAFGGTIGKNETVAIMTGAKIPAGCDTVVQQELTERVDDLHVRILKSLSQGASIRAAGKDIRKGDTVLCKGQMLRSQEIGILASLGKQFIPVYRTPSVAVLPTGNEIVELDKPVPEGKIRNSNAYSLLALIQESGGEGINLGIAKDDPKELKAKILEGLKADMLVTSGGVSVGKYDLVLEELKGAGVEIHFWKVNIKPGMPLLFGTHQGKPVFGLPGNPVSTMVTFLQFVRPALRRMMGQTDEPLRLRARISHEVGKNDGKRHFMRGILEHTGGGLTVRSAGVQDSNIL